MIEAVYKIGKIQPKDFLQGFIDEIGDNYKNIFKIVIDVTNHKEPEYIGIAYEQNDLKKKLKYFYKKGSANGPDQTPTSKITTIGKTFKNKLKNYFKKFLDENKNMIQNNDKELIEALQNLINDSCETIKKDLIEFGDKGNYLKNDKDSFKDPSVITFVFRENNNDKYVGDMSFVNVFKKNKDIAYKNFYKKSIGESLAKNKYCFICNKIANKVWGFVNTYNFYTADKKSYIAGGFNPSLMWHNYPVCPDCADILETGKRYIEKNLSYRFSGFNYYLIPELLFDNNNMLWQILNKLKNYSNFSSQEQKGTLIRKTEERILKDLSKLSNQINFNFLFYEKSNAAFKVLLFLREVAPSRLKFLTEKMDKVDKQKKFDIFEEIKTKKNTINFDFSFSFLREFFPNSKIDGKFDKYFLEILNSIFIGKNIDVNFLLGRFMGKIRKEFLNDQWYKPTVLKSYKILLYLEEICLLRRRKKNMKNYGNNFEEFFTENPIIDDETKKALFLEGVLAKKLLNIQYEERQATPFRSRLNGLKIDEKTAKRLFPEIINKLEEYNKNYYHKLEEITAEYLVKADFSPYSVDELSYYFVLGLVLHKYFKHEESNSDNNRG